MSRGVVFAILLLAWVGTGLVAAVRTARRGHFLPAWLALGVVCGPLTFGLARVDRQRESSARPERQTAGRIGSGPVDVLVGVDGSAESFAVLRFVVDVLEGRVGRLTVAEVLDYDTTLAETEHPERTKATAALRSAASMAAGRTGIEPETVLLAGHPPDALARFAGDEGFGLVVVGGRGRGLSKALLGSTADGLSRSCPVPVFVVSNAASRGSAGWRPDEATAPHAT